MCNSLLILVQCLHVSSFFFLCVCSLRRVSCTGTQSIQVFRIHLFVHRLLRVHNVYRRDGTPLEQYKWEHLRLGKALMATCWNMFESTPSGLSPETAMFTTDPPSLTPKADVRRALC